MFPKEYQFPISRIGGVPENITIKPGEIVLVVGRNGVGKSVLMQHIFTQTQKVAKWVLANRTIWMESNTSGFSPSQIEQALRNIAETDGASGRIKDGYYNTRYQWSLLMVLLEENEYSRSLANAVKTGNNTLREQFTKIFTPIEKINSFFAAAGLNIVISLNKLQEFLASKDGGPPYSIVELSDGEKNILQLAADLAIVPTGSLVLLDEPERHLHDSIVHPFLRSLVKARPDCAFVVSTHDIKLPTTLDSVHMLLIRNVRFTNNVPAWEFDRINNVQVPEFLKTEIYGARRKMLFVEGKLNSPDKDLYSALFPDFSIESKESCEQVIRSVEGIQSNKNLHWVEVGGLIDADGRTTENIQDLEAKGIFAIPAYSVEYLYFNSGTVQIMAEDFAQYLGRNAKDLYQQAMNNVIPAFIKERNNLCALVCAKAIGEQITKLKPSYKDILAGGQFQPPAIDIGKALADEQQLFDNLASSGQIDGLLQRYPIKRTQVIAGIVAPFAREAKVYEERVRTLARENGALRTHLLQILGPLDVKLNGAGNRAMPIGAAANLVAP